MSRQLVSGEMIAVEVDGYNPQGGGQYTTLESDNSIILSNIESGIRTFAIKGHYNGTLMYGSDSKTLNVPKRPKLTSDIIGVRGVSCNAGSDGEIVVEATGGTQSYIARLYRAYQNDVIQEVAFSQSGFGTFTRLELGDYEVRISDTNDCTAYNDNGTVRVLQMTVGQPAQPLAVGLEQLVAPLSHDSHDGKATVRISGGTPDTKGYNALLTHSDGQTYSPAVKSADGNDALYTFNGLPKGDYSVVVQDKNYASLDPQDKVEPCGCIAALSFYLDAPPAINVAIEETHFVNWHGGNQGVLVAHASGGIQLQNDLPYQYAWYRQSEGGAMQPLSIPADSIARNLIAGLYQVKVTDANGVSKTSAVYTLSQPDPIRVQFNVVKTGCYGDASGKISATVSGGVPPYTYQWNLEGETQSEVSSLEAGTYMLKVTDERGGHLLSYVEVDSSSTLKVDSLVMQPSCVAGGSIKLQLSGATPPYTIKWDDTSRTDLIRDELMPGIYRVSVTDANGCANSFTFELKQPRGFTVNIGGDLVMCRNQSRVMEAMCDEPNVTYEWYLNDAKLPDTGNRITVESEGNYRVRVTNPDGCFATDQINVRVTGETLELDMTVPTTVEVGSEIHAINLSKVTADRIEWKLPDGAVIVSQSDTELIFSLTKKGSFEIYMEGFKGEGATIVSRTINVVDKGEVSLPDNEEPLIKQFWVTPSPSTGIFKVIVELNQAEDFTMVLYSPLGVEMDRKVVENVQSKTFEYEVNGVLQGTYLLHLTTKSDKSVLQVVIKK